MTLNTRDQLILNWRQAQVEMKAAVAKEAELRLEVVKMLFPTQANDTTAEGTENFELGNGYKVKAVFKVNYTLANYDRVSDVLSRIRRLGTVDAADAYKNLVRYKPELKLSTYRNLPEIIRKMIDEVISTKPGLPTLDLIEPEEK